MSNAVAPGQMTKHYAPDIPTYIVGNNNNFILNQKSLYIKLNSSFVIDFGGKLLHLKDNSNHYIDLSVSGNAKEACYKLFNILRISESSEMVAKGVRTVLLPDLQIEDLEGIDTGRVDDLEVALWERLYRAASGIRIPEASLT